MLPIAAKQGAGSFAFCRRPYFFAFILFGEDFFFVIRKSGL